MAAVFHEESGESEASVRYSNYVEYGRRMMKMLDEVKTEIG
jgi:hypothetical protein